MSSVMASESAAIAKAILRRALRLIVSQESIRESLIQLDRTAGSICENLVYVDGDARIQATHQTDRDFFFLVDPTKTLNTQWIGRQRMGELPRSVLCVCVATK